MSVRAEEQVTYFVCDRQPEERRTIRIRLASQPLDAIHEHCRELSGTRVRVDERVTELEPSARENGRRQTHEANRQLPLAERRFALGRRPIAARHPDNLDAGGGQHAGCRPQRRRVGNRRHDPRVIDSHRDRRPAEAVNGHG